jgi:hypothetical protein
MSPKSRRDSLMAIGLFAWFSNGKRCEAERQGGTPV